MNPTQIEQIPLGQFDRVPGDTIGDAIRPGLLFDRLIERITVHRAIPIDKLLGPLTNQLADLRLWCE